MNYPQTIFSASTLVSQPVEIKEPALVETSHKLNLPITYDALGASQVVVTTAQLRKLFDEIAGALT